VGSVSAAGPEPLSGAATALSMKIAYIVHDLTDAAVSKRVSMLIAGGAEVVIAGFRRHPTPVTSVAGLPAVDLGETFDARLAHRALMGLRLVADPARLADIIRGSDVVMARNLEILLVAAEARRRYSAEARLVYECLDIHETMIGTSLKSRALRGLEQWLMRRTDLLLISSPGFVSHYFEPMQAQVPPTFLVENKFLDLDGSIGESLGLTREHDLSGPPWRIGWFGMLRAQKALDCLCAIATALPGKVEVVIRGKPTSADFTDFIGQIEATPGVSFGGSYRPDEIAALYADVHLCWAIDLTVESGNSRWLLPNRIYEGGRHGAVPIAISDSQTGRWLADNGVGVCVDRPVEDTITLVESLTPDRFARLREAASRLPAERVVAGRADCEALVRAIAGVTRSSDVLRT
jgi:succinoglycan biosynthesis protein ExoL